MSAKKFIAPLFIGHGAPTVPIERQHYFHKYLRKLGKQLLNQKPRAIIVFSAHYEDSNNVLVTYTDKVYETVHDFYGFPRELYELQYPAKGSTKIADEVVDLLTKANIKAKKDPKSGLDHGTWTILYTMFYNEKFVPCQEALDIPVIQCSVAPYNSVEHHIAIGKALFPLTKLSEDENLNKEEGNVLIIGSGATVHNLGKLSWNKLGKTSIEQADKWAVQFDDWLIESLKKQNDSQLNDYLKLAPNAKMAVPRAEHFYPVFIGYGARASGNTISQEEGDSGSVALEDKVKILERCYDGGSLSYLAIEFN
ncbi:hypothetical protein ABK040_016569 [Willaertia magna]